MARATENRCCDADEEEAVADSKSEGETTVFEAGGRTKSSAVSADEDEDGNDCGTTRGGLGVDGGWIVAVAAAAA